MALFRCASGSSGGGTQSTVKRFTFGNAVNCGFAPKKIVYQISDSGVGAVMLVYDNGNLYEYYSDEQQHDVTSYLSSFLNISSTGFTVKKGSGSWSEVAYYAYVEG